MLKNLSIGWKLGLGLGLVVLCMVLVNGITYFGLQSINKNVVLTSQAGADRAFAIEKEVDHLKWMAGLCELWLDPNATGVTVQTDDHKCGLGKWLYSEETQKLAESDPELGTLLKAMEAPHFRLHSSASKINDIYKGVGTYAMTPPEERKQASFAVFLSDTKPAVAETQKRLGELKDFFSNRSKTLEAEIESQIATSVTVLVTLSILAALLGAGAGWFAIRSVTGPISRVVKATEAMNREFAGMETVIEAIAANDLTKDVAESQIQRIGVNSRDEIGRLVESIEDTIACRDRMGVSVRRMVTSLNNMVRQLSDNARELVSAATQVASTSEQMSNGAHRQTAQVTQVSSAVEEMTATIIGSSKNAGDASETAGSASQTAIQGGEVVSQTILGMQKIADTVRESADSIGKLAKSAEQIGAIINVIDDIADQTNLLALNAAIEAARAGEQGRGFAVVADEVRKLAERTGKATGEITAMIKGIQVQTDDAVKSMQSGIQQVEKGRMLADEAGNSLNEIVTMSQKVMDMIQQIASSTAEQSTAAEEISRTIELVASISDESATGAEQSASAAEQLNRQAEGLQQMVASFQLRSGDSGIIELAKQDHMLYIKKLEQVVRRPESAGNWKTVDHHNCRFGKWYYSAATTGMRGDSAYRCLEDPHAKVHEFANRAVEAVKASRGEQAAHLSEQAHQASHEVVTKLAELAEHMSANVGK